MKARSLAFASIALTLAWLAITDTRLPAATSRMPLDEIQPGMVGTGVTVFDGTKREEFRATIIGVLRNVVGPRRNLILARLEGGPLAQTGVIQGMSGSPVYVDGRLIGAVSYSLGAFSKEAIAGVTPIDEMLEAVALPGSRPATRQAKLNIPVSREGLAGALREAFAEIRPFADRAADVAAIGLPAAAAGQMGTMLRPIATPLVMGGFGPELMQLLAEAFSRQGFVPVVAGTAASAAASDEPLQPGDPVAVSLISGDLALAATGTATLIEDGRVYAFGHPFYNLGPTQFPMSRAYVHALLPSLFTSVKIASVGPTIGTFQQDRATAIAGTLGQIPPLIPITLRLESADRSRTETFAFSVVNDQLFTPLLTYVSILNTLRSYEREFGAATFTVQGRASLKEHGAISFEDVFTGEAPSVGAATYVAAPITFVLGNDFAPVELEAIDISITSTERPRTATLERVWLEETEVRAGRTVPLKVLMRTYRGEELVRTVPLDVPANAHGSLTVLVADAPTLTQWETRELRRPVQPQNIEQMIRALNDARKNSRLYVRLLRPEAGAVVKGELLSSLPPSVLAVLEADRNGGSYIPLRTATVGKWEIATDYAVRGSRTLTLNIEDQ